MTAPIKNPVAPRRMMASRHTPLRVRPSNFFASAMSSTSFARSALIFPDCLSWAIVSGTLVAALAVAPPVSAQPQRPGSEPSIYHPRTYPTEESRPPSGSRLPGWAEPAAPQNRVGSDGPSGPNEASRNGISSFPGNGDRVPLSGLEWLLAAGLGYGAYRLRGQGDDDAAA